MKNITINCDSCNADLSPKTTGYSNHYIIKVSVEDIEIRKGGQPIFLMFISPPILKDLYFCGMHCMKNFKYEVFNEK